VIAVHVGQILDDDSFVLVGIQSESDVTGSHDLDETSGGHVRHILSVAFVNVKDRLLASAASRADAIGGVLGNHSGFAEELASWLRVISFTGPVDRLVVGLGSTSVDWDWLGRSGSWNTRIDSDNLGG
jgi:hypothetical protein